MCGIIGCVGNKNAMPAVLGGLRRLEYRGYDSVGIAALSKQGISIKKDVGKVNEVHAKLNLLLPKAHVAIGHTRWATHGNVTKENAHPHIDCSGEIAVVHNGIIENYQELKASLSKRGHIFRSSTDTEVLPHLIEENLKKSKNLEEACAKAANALDGTFAMLILHKGENKIIAVKKGSPLVIGTSSNMFFAASDIPAFLKYTKRVAHLHDYDLVSLSKTVTFYSIKDASLKKVTRPFEEVDWKYAGASKGRFEHYMLKEIIEQIETIKKAAKQDSSLLDSVIALMMHTKDIYLIACGSSYYACLAARHVFSAIANTNLNVVQASEFKEYSKFITPQTLVIAVSQSGETYDVLDAIKLARNARCKLVSITNVRGSSLARESDIVLPMNAGPEISVLATKTYTSQVALLTLIAYSLANMREVGKKRLDYLWNVIYYLTSVSRRNAIKALAVSLKGKNHIICIGRGMQFATALEAALKIKEVSYTHAEAFAGGELKHGPIALIEKQTPCIVFVSQDNEREIISNALEVRARGGYVIGVSPKNNVAFDKWISVPECETENPIVQIIPIQILAYQLAVLKGNDPDHPRSLAKSVTVK